MISCVADEGTTETVKQGEHTEESSAKLILDAVTQVKDIYFEGTLHVFMYLRTLQQKT